METLQESYRKLSPALRAAFHERFGDMGLTEVESSPTVATTRLREVVAPRQQVPEASDPSAGVRRIAAMTDAELDAMKASWTPEQWALYRKERGVPGENPFLPRREEAEGNPIVRLARGQSAGNPFVTRRATGATTPARIFD
jgi:hypothetical protein